MQTALRQVRLQELASLCRIPGTLTFLATLKNENKSTSCTGHRVDLASPRVPRVRTLSCTPSLVRHFQAYSCVRRALARLYPARRLDERHRYAVSWVSNASQSRSRLIVDQTACGRRAKMTGCRRVKMSRILWGVPLRGRPQVPAPQRAPASANRCPRRPARCGFYDFSRGNRAESRIGSRVLSLHAKKRTSHRIAGSNCEYANRTGVPALTRSRLGQTVSELRTVRMAASRSGGAGRA